MPTPSPLRKVVPLVLAAVLAAPWALAAGPRRAAAPAHATVQTAPAPWVLFGRLWSALTSVWAETGCHLDPNGACAPDQGSGLAAPADTGCRLDPDGCAALQAVSPAAEGCRLDPNGCLQ